MKQNNKLQEIWINKYLAIYALPSFYEQCFDKKQQ